MPPPYKICISNISCDRNVNVFRLWRISEYDSIFNCEDSYFIFIIDAGVMLMNTHLIDKILAVLKWNAIVTVYNIVACCIESLIA